MNILQFFTKKSAIGFILITTFLNFLGFSIIIPVLPFLVEKYVNTTNPNIIGFYVGILMSVYALCQFLAAPGLGILSDRFGRRPILLVSLAGSVVGYIFLGIAGSLWMLFLGRIIDGLTGGNISTIYAYIADITEPKQRGRFYGLLGAAGGVGFMIGPVVGGYLGALHLSAPFYLAAAVTLLNMVWGYFVLPESLKTEHKLTTISLVHLNPFSQFEHIFSIKTLRILFFSAFLFFLPLMAYQAIAAIFMKDVLSFGPAGIGTVLFVVGVVDIVSQGFLTHKLVPILGELKLTVLGLFIIGIGYALVASVAIIPSVLLLYIGVIILIIGDGLFEPSMSGLISNAVESRMQGRVQGANQSMQSAARVVGPFYGGWVYQLGKSVPFFSNIIFVVLAMIPLFLFHSHIKDHNQL